MIIEVQVRFLSCWTHEADKHRHALSDKPSDPSDIRVYGCAITTQDESKTTYVIGGWTPFRADAENTAETLAMLHERGALK